jgi:hypothetical protein
MELDSDLIEIRKLRAPSASLKEHDRKKHKRVRDSARTSRRKPFQDEFQRRKSHTVRPKSREKDSRFTHSSDRGIKSPCINHSPDCTWLRQVMQTFPQLPPLDLVACDKCKLALWDVNKRVPSAFQSLVIVPPSSKENQKENYEDLPSLDVKNLEAFVLLDPHAPFVVWKRCVLDNLDTLKVVLIHTSEDTNTRDLHQLLRTRSLSHLKWSSL